LEAGVREHACVLVESVGVAFGGGGEHNEAEPGGGWRGDAIRIWDEVDDRDGGPPGRRAVWVLRRKWTQSAVLKWWRKLGMRMRS
jgi:hypothetical protein